MRSSAIVAGLLGVLVLAGCQQANHSASAPTGSASLTSGSAAPAGPGAITPDNTMIEWTGTKKEGKHVGGFKRFSGSIQPVNGDLTAGKITLDIDTDSLYSDNPKLTGHLKSPDFFEVSKYPRATFVSTAIKADKDATHDVTHQITGDLTLHGTTKSITIPAKVTESADTLAVASTFTINRLDYGIAFQPQRVDPMVTIKVSARVPRK